MSKGPGRAQRFVLERLEKLGLDDPREYWIVEDLTYDYFEVEYVPTVAQIETIRRAVRTLDQRGLVETRHRPYPYECPDGRVIRKRFLVARLPLSAEEADAERAQQSEELASFMRGLSR